MQVRRRTNEIKIHMFFMALPRLGAVVCFIFFAGCDAFSGQPSCTPLAIPRRIGRELDAVLHSSHEIPALFPLFVGRHRRRKRRSIS